MAGKVIIGIIVGVLLVVVGVGAWAAIYGVNGNSAEVNIRVNSAHIASDVEISVYINDNLIMYNENVSPGEYIEKLNAYRFPIWDSSRTITIKAVSEGGLLGTWTDTNTLVIKGGQSYTVNLFV